MKCTVQNYQKTFWSHQIDLSHLRCSFCFVLFRITLLLFDPWLYSIDTIWYEGHVPWIDTRCRYAWPLAAFHWYYLIWRSCPMNRHTVSICSIICYIVSSCRDHYPPLTNHNKTQQTRTGWTILSMLLNTISGYTPNHTCIILIQPSHAK